MYVTILCSKLWWPLACPSYEGHRTRNKKVYWKFVLNSAAEFFSVNNTIYSILYFLEPAIISVNDKGPLLLTPFMTPAVHKTHLMGIGKEWECHAVADGDVIYRWYKDDVVCKIHSSLDIVLKLWTTLSKYFIKKLA